MIFTYGRKIIKINNYNKLNSFSMVTCSTGFMEALILLRGVPWPLLVWTLDDYNKININTII